MTNKIALVTGGSRGIGEAIVLECAARGMDVAFCYQSNVDKAREVAQAAEAYGVRALASQCDVADGDQVNLWLKQVSEELGDIDVVVNSAGITRDNPLVLMSAQDWHQVVETNMTGVFNVCRAVVLDMMKKKQGSIINLSSVSGVYGNPTQCNYAATKAGIIGFSKSLAKEVAGYGVRVNVVAPGFIETDMTSKINEKRLKELIGGIPLKRMGGAEEVAKLVTFLASPDAAYITGQVIGIDGGLVI